MIKKIIENLKYFLFLIKKKPWSIGYFEYKKRYIQKALELLLENKIDVNNLPKNYGFRIDERVVEYLWVFSNLNDKSGNLLDAGSSLNYDFIINNPKLKNKNITIMTLSHEANCFYNLDISYLFGDLRNTCFKDNYFDYIVSISTIEHIGLDNTLLYSSNKNYCENNVNAHLDAILEFKRILKPNGELYLTIPYGKYKNHGWFQVFDLKMINEIIKTFKPSFFSLNFFQYKPNGWINSNAYLTKDCECFDASLNKKLDSDFAAFSRAVACIKIIK